MTPLNLVDHSPRAMTARARAYLSAAGYRHFTIGAFLLVLPWLFSAAAFIPIFGLVPLVAWGVIMTAEGIACTAAAVTRNATIARASIAVSAVITLTMAMGLWVGVIASWNRWIALVGWEQVWSLVAARPDTFPAALLLLAAAPPSPFLPVVLTALTVKDFVMCAQPLRVPLEESVHRVRMA